MTSPQRKSSQAEELHKVGEQLVELVAKIQLIEEDRKGFVESSNFTYKSNDAKISALRSENKELAKKFVKSSTTYEETLDIVFEGGHFFSPKLRLQEMGHFRWFWRGREGDLNFEVDLKSHPP